MLIIIIIEFLISRRSRKKIQIQESYDISNHAYVIFSPSLSIFVFSIFCSFLPLLFEIHVDQVLVTSQCHIGALRHWATKLFDSTSRRVDVATLGLGSPIYFFKPPHILQMSSFSPEMHKKPSIQYKAINTLINV